MPALGRARTTAPPGRTPTVMARQTCPHLAGAVRRDNAHLRLIRHLRRLRHDHRCLMICERDVNSLARGEFRTAHLRQLHSVTERIVDQCAFGVQCLGRVRLRSLWASALLPAHEAWRCDSAHEHRRRSLRPAQMCSKKFKQPGGAFAESSAFVEPNGQDLGAARELGVPGWVSVLRRAEETGDALVSDHTDARKRLIGWPILDRMTICRNGRRWRRDIAAAGVLSGQSAAPSASPPAALEW